MKQVRFLLGAISFILLGMNMHAQEQDLDVEIKEKMDVVLEHIDKSKIETGLLADYGAWLLDPYDYDGTISEDNYGSIGFWKMLYLGAYTSQINNSSHLAEPEAVFAGLPSDSPAILYLQYNSIDEQAVEKGILTYENEQLRETGSSMSPYVKRKLFVFALPDKEYSQSVSFTFRRESYIHNLPGMPSQMFIRFDNNLPFQQVTWGQIVRYTYPSSGNKEVTVRLKMPDGSYVEGHAQIQIATNGPRRDDEKDPVDERIWIPATSEHSGGEIQIKYATFLNDSASLNDPEKEKKLTRPLIIADESELLQFFSDSLKMDLRYLLTNNSISKVVTEINKIYDIVYIDNNDSFDDIFRNAKLFEDAIQIINAKRGATHDKNYVVGLGMGGLVARYALRDMENQKEDHDVVKFITVNSPHKGANIPVGIQATLQYLRNRKVIKWVMSDLYDKVNDIRKLFDKKAMRQMLIYTMDKNYNYLNDHNAFMQEYERMGMPQQCKNIAVSNGGLGNAFIGTEGSLLFQRRDKAFGVDISAYFLKHKMESQFFNGAVKGLWIKFKKVNLKSNSTMVAADGAPGSFIPLTILSNDLAKYLKVSNFCFVPTVSALGFNEWEERLLSPSSLNSSMSCFDQLYVADKSNGYQELAACKDALTEELAPLIKGTNGPIIGETEYKLINLPAMITSNPTITSLFVKWRISNENFKIMPNGDKVIVVPQVSNSTAKLIVSLSLDRKTSSDVDSIQLSSGDFDILSDSGDYILRGAGSRFRVNMFSPSSTITWSYMDRIQVKEQKDDYIDIAGCGIFGGWLQADVTVNGAKFSKRVWLGYEALPSDLKISVSNVKWRRDNGEIWYLLHADHKPCVSGETFEWKLRSTYMGGKCAEFYTPNTGGPNKGAPGNGGYTPIDFGILIPEGSFDMELWYEKNIDALPTDYRILICNGNTSYTDVSCSLKSPCRTLDANIVMSFSGEVPAWEVPELELKFGSLYTKGSLNWQSVYLEHTPCNTSKENITWELSVGNGEKPVLSDRRPVEFHMGGDTPTLYRDSVWAAHNEIFIVYSDTELSYSMNWIKCQLKVGDKIFNNRIVWPGLKAVVPVVPNPGDEIIWIGGGLGGGPIGRNGISPMSVSASNTPSGLYSIRIYGNYGLVRSFDNVSLDVPFEVNTADLPNGNYYLNVFRDGTLVDQQIIMIQH